MKRFTLLLAILGITLLNLLVGCNGLDDSYSSNPNHRLSFSRDTLSFDTVFSRVGSTTRQFMVYNTNREALNIESILLAGGGATGFRMNVDGQKGTAFSNVSILAEDSMYVFVEVTVNPTQVDQPLLIQDSVVFVTNGIRQSVLLEAYGQDVNLYKGGVTLYNDTTLTAQRPYLVYDSLTIAPGATVTIEKGATFYMHDRANIQVFGTLLANGNQEKPITFRGDRLDFVLENVLPYDRTPGQWGGLFFKEESFGNQLKHVLFRNGTTGIACELSTPDKSKLEIHNSQITNMSQDAFSAINCHITATNSEFSNAKGSVVTLVGGSYRFVHCTMTNFMTLLSRLGSDSKTLRVFNNATVNESGPYPITEARFDNCIVDGSFSAGETPLGGELQLVDGGKVNASVPNFSFLFNSCMLKTKEVTDSHFSQVIFVAKSPSYRMVGQQNKNYAFDFRPATDKEPFVGKANPTISAQYPTDRYGVSRLSSPHGPSMGAYEYVAP